MKNIENVILSNLVFNEKYARKVLPFLKDEYFFDTSERHVFETIAAFIDQYNGLPTKTALELAIQDANLSESDFNEVAEVVSGIEKDEQSFDWLVEQSEKFCKDKAMFLALSQSVRIMEGKDKELSADAIPKILQDALATGFDLSIGHDYTEDAEKRFEFYHNVENRVPFDIDMLNRISKGGLPNKTLNIFLAGTGVGKSLVMCHMAAAAKAQGRNVLYITMEMAEERIAERIDANLMNVDIDQLPSLSKEKFMSRVEYIRKKSEGKLIIKEYPTGVAHAGHFRAAIREMKLKKNFVPDIVFIDYLNICSSSRFKSKGNTTSYEYIKSIAEELRSLAMELNVPIVSATQTTRSGYNNSDVELTDTSESFGLPATADIMLAIISTEELEKMGQFLIKQLKNRYRDPSRDRRFLVGVDKNKMRLYDIESPTENVMDDSLMNRIEEESGMQPLIFKLTELADRSDKPKK